MAAKQSQEMREAIRLVQSGVNHTEAAIRAGVSRTGLQIALKKLGLLKNDKKPLDTVK